MSVAQHHNITRDLAESIGVVRVPRPLPVEEHLTIGGLLEWAGRLTEDERALVVGAIGALDGIPIGRRSAESLLAQTHAYLDSTHVPTRNSLLARRHTLRPVTLAQLRMVAERLRREGAILDKTLDACERMR